MVLAQDPSGFLLGNGEPKFLVILSFTNYQSKIVC